jgi:chromate reductase
VQGGVVIQDSAFAVPDVVPRDVKFLVLAASPRAESLNVHLAHLAARVIPANNGGVDAPSFNANLEGEDGPPAGAMELRRRLEACDAFVIASPEYGASIPGILKNAIGWVSRLRPNPSMSVLDC